MYQHYWDSGPSLENIHTLHNQLNWRTHAWRKSSLKTLQFHTSSSSTNIWRSEELIFPCSNGFQHQQVEWMRQIAEQGQGSYGVLWWHEFLNIWKLSSFPTAVIPKSLYSLALEVLRSDVVLVRKLGVPPLALDSTPYGVDCATVTLTLSLNACWCLSHRLRVVRGVFICREEVLFHFLKTEPASGCQVWTRYCSSNHCNWSSLVKLPIWCLLQNNFLLFTFTTSIKSK